MLVGMGDTGSQRRSGSGLSVPVIGLAGGVGSGKSLVAEALAQQGAAVINADHLAHEALNDPDIREQLHQWWGDPVLDAEGRVDRRAVGRIVFDQPEQLRRLESIVHPRVAEKRFERRRQLEADAGVRAIVEDCPLLFEKGIDKECDVVIFVASSRENRLRRVLSSRGWTVDELDRREKNQWDLDRKADLADYVIQNNAGPAEVFEQVRDVFSQILAEA